jgi:ribonuclease BN (tRNA processing enzyme)
MRLVPLGTNGYIPSQGRQTMAYLVLTDDTAILLDAGSGVARLLEPEIEALLEGYSRLELVLTHYHLDHVVGMSFLPGVWPTRPVRIHAPGPPLVEATPDDALCRLIHPPLFPIPLPEFPMPVELERLTGAPVAIGGVELRFRAQQHPGGSAGVRLGDAMAYVTDTVADDASADFARGVDLLLHEVWLGPGGEAGSTGHSAADEVARIATRAGVRRLMPVHHHPRATAEDLERLAVELAKRVDGVEIVLPEEGRVYEIGTSSPS